MSFINKFDDYNINRGVELLLRRRKEELRLRKFNFEKVITFFKKELHIKIEFFVNKS
jgi:hypothetical protein